MRSKEQIAVLHDLFNQINERLGIIGETPDAYFLCRCVEILKQQGQTIDAQAARITDLEAQLSDAKQVANDCRIVADNAIAEAAKNQWIPVSERLPESGKAVLACYTNDYGNGRRIRAKWVADKSCESSSESDFGEYDEASDTYYDPEGWYECIDNAVDYTAMFVNDTITHWIPLPAPPIQAKGKV